jgi:hypothetical protein
MPKKRKFFETPTNLEFFFTPTKDTSGEISKAIFKNLNLPILQYWYNGSETKPLKCMISGKPAFSIFPDLISKKKKQRFDCDFNHIRQHQDGNSRSGNSIDKSGTDPSAIFRAKDLSGRFNKEYLVEFMTTMPVSREMHSYINQDSAKGDLTLTNFKKSWWPWGLRSKKNFDKFCEKFDLDIDYDTFIGRLSDAGWPNIVKSYTMGTLSKSIVR